MGSPIEARGCCRVSEAVLWCASLDAFRACFGPFIASCESETGTYTVSSWQVVEDRQRVFCTSYRHRRDVEAQPVASAERRDLTQMSPKQTHRQFPNWKGDFPMSQSGRSTRRTETQSHS